MCRISKESSLCWVRLGLRRLTWMTGFLTLVSAYTFLLGYSQIPLTPAGFDNSSERSMSAESTIERLQALEQLFWILNSIDVSFKCSSWDTLAPICSRHDDLSGVGEWITDQSQASSRNKIRKKRVRRHLVNQSLVDVQRKSSSTTGINKTALSYKVTSDHSHKYSLQSRKRRRIMENLANLESEVGKKPLKAPLNYSYQSRHVCADWLTIHSECRVITYTDHNCPYLEQDLLHRGCRVHLFTVDHHQESTSITNTVANTAQLSVHSTESLTKVGLDIDGAMLPLDQALPMTGWLNQIVPYMTLDIEQNNMEWATLLNILTTSRIMKKTVKQFTLRVRITSLLQVLLAGIKKNQPQKQQHQQLDEVSIEKTVNLPYVQHLCDVLTHLQLAGFKLVHTESFGPCLSLEIGCLATEFVTLWINQDLKF